MPIEIIGAGTIGLAIVAERQNGTFVMAVVPMDFLWKRALGQR